MADDTVYIVIVANSNTTSTFRWLMLCANIGHLIADACRRDKIISAQHFDCVNLSIMFAGIIIEMVCLHSLTYRYLKNCQRFIAGYRVPLSPVMWSALPHFKPSLCMQILVLVHIYFFLYLFVLICR